MKFYLHFAETERIKLFSVHCRCMCYHVYQMTCMRLSICGRAVVVLPHYALIAQRPAGYCLSLTLGPLYHLIPPPFRHVGCTPTSKVSHIWQLWKYFQIYNWKYIKARQHTNSISLLCHVYDFSHKCAKFHKIVYNISQDLHDNQVKISFSLYRNSQDRYWPPWTRLIA